MKLLVALAFLALATAELQGPEPIHLQEPDMPQQVYPVDARPLIVPPQILEAIKAMEPEAVGYEVPADGINFVNSPDDVVMFVEEPEYGYKRPVKIYYDPNLR